ncbi:MAG: class I SAM-dependent methyltransferase [Planctomycetota bacterium]|nr:class I SAM-dependent methyltransferase [Planctomycetota bacterium]
MPAADREKWDAKYRARGETIFPPSPFVLSVLDRLPTTGRCLDVAGGTGRNARPLAAHGLDVTLADVSPAGLEIAEREAREAGVAIRTLEHDVETDGLPEGPWDVLVQVRFLHRPLFTQYAAVLAPGGLFVLDHPTRTNLERHERPSGHWLLEDGELPELLVAHAPELEVLEYEEGWGEDKRHSARLLARRYP